MRTFAGIEQEFATFERAHIILQSIPYDGTSSWGKGADKGFASFLKAAENMELYDIETDSEVFRRGIYMPSAWADFTSPEDMYTEVYKRTKELLKSEKFLTFFGGEHSISIGLIKAFYEHYNHLTVLQLDAHADLRPSYEGSVYNHACAMYNANKNTNLIQVGIRSMDKREKDEMDYYQTYFADEIHKSNEWIVSSIEQMTDSVYISIDLDVLDPSIMPATGTPEPGGMTWYGLISYIRQVFEQKNVVGFDIVELAPIPGIHFPEFLAAKLYYKMLSYKFSNK